LQNKCEGVGLLLVAVVVVAIVVLKIKKNKGDPLPTEDM